MSLAAFDLGGASRLGIATTVTAASAAVRMIAKNELSSTVINAGAFSRFGVGAVGYSE